MIRRTRIIWQVFFLGLFLALLYLATQQRIDGWAVGLFAWIDPLISVTTTVAAAAGVSWVRIVCAGGIVLAGGILLWPGKHGGLRKWLAAAIALTTAAVLIVAGSVTFHAALALSLVTILSAVFLGRVFCGWVCPFGTISHGVGWLGGRWRSQKQKIAVRRYHKLFAVKYYLLALLLIAAVFGVQQAGLLDPIALLTRSLTVSVLPLADEAGLELGGDAYRRWAWFPQVHYTSGAWVIVLVFAGLVLANLWIPRFFCKFLCPLGAGLGLLSRFSLLRHRRRESLCIDCGRCDAVCPAGAEPAEKLRVSECMECFNCSEVCPTRAVRFEPVGDDNVPERQQPDLSRRNLIAAATVGVLALPVARWLGAARARPNPKLIRPPGSLGEEQFLAACVKCQLCARACPTGVIQPASSQAGWEGVWTPVMDFKLGYCEYNCNACGEACPTGAIRRLTLDRKHGQGRYANDGPVRLGTAFVNRGRCLPWATATPCIVCQEVCPVSPKAIYIERVRVTNRRGESVELQRPWVDPQHCIGCGICSHKCPIEDSPAIYVTAINATRDSSRRLTL